MMPSPLPECSNERALRVGGMTRFTNIDYPHKLAAVVFVQGCPWRCGYCHNPHLQPRQFDEREPALDWPEVLAWLRSRIGLLDAVVFSGGEPTMDPALPGAIADVRQLGFDVGLHTAGIYPRRLGAVLPLLDWVGVDVKAPLDADARYDAIVGARGSVRRVRDAVRMVLDSGVPCEFRTTAAPQWLADDELLKLASSLANLGASTYALQLARPAGPGRVPSAAEYPSVETLEQLGEMFATFILRRS